jgi:hypothetical protein
MGVRRGWKALMKPRGLKTWPDVLGHTQKVQKFVENLKDQVFYIRRGPSTGTPTMSNGKKVDAILSNLVAEVEDARGRARHWFDVSEGRVPPGHFSQEDAERSLRGWTTDFQEAVDSGIAGGLTPMLDKALKLLREDAKRIVEHDKWSPEPFEMPTSFKEFSLGRAKVVIDDRTVLPGQIQGYIKYLDKAQKMLAKKGFGKVWYGTLFVKCESCGGANMYDPSLGVGGNYPVGPDVVNIFERPGESTTRLVIHELGHRWWYKFMDRGARLQFEDWVNNGLGAVSAYGSKHPREAFAEAFKHYVLGLKMTPQQALTFKMVALGRGLTASVVQQVLPK